MASEPVPESVDEYVDGLPERTRSAVQEIRDRVRAVLPGADEVIRYGIPTFRVDGTSVLHVAGWKAHVSLYPGPDDESGLAEELAPHVSGRGTLKFPLSRPIPYDLIGRVAAARLAEVRRAG